MATRTDAREAVARRWGLLLVALAGSAHRTVLFLVHRDDLHTLIAANATWYTTQNAPLALLREHLGTTLLLLQQTPPMSSLVIGVLERFVEWPVAGAEALIALQGGISIVTALLLHRLLDICFPRHLVLVTVVGIAFVLDTGLVVIEYTSLGQLIYENLGMLLVLAFAMSLIRLRGSARPVDAALAGLLAALLVLTRATWSFLVLPGVVLVMLLAARAPLRLGIAFVVPLLVLQGGWVAKNWMLYGRFSPATSSWTGFNLMNGFDRLGHGPVFLDFLRARRDPPWLPTVFEKPPVPPLEEIVPAEYGDRDRALGARFGVTPWGANSAAAAAFYDALGENFAAFARTHPKLVLEKAARSYAIFWEPTANYGALNVSLFAPEAPAPSALDVPRFVRDLGTVRLPQRIGVAYGTLHIGAPLPVRRTSIGTLPWLEVPRLLAEVLGVHVLAPLAALGWLRRRRGLREPDATRGAVLLVCAALYGYLAMASSVGEYGENMRFRLGVEPLVWVLSLLGAAGSWQLVLACVRGARSLQTGEDERSPCPS